ncbi:MAG: hypothetical protein QG585_345 [Patescibacteria group bacterium]|jgi:hypothetical protein|nr:hypothetical protein [Patescibacteria group bacterium]
MIELQPGENILYEVRKHWFHLFVWGLVLCLMAVVPLILGGILTVMIFGSLTEQAVSVAGLFYTLWLGLLWIIFFVEWTDYRLDVWVITNQRIIDIDQRGLFNRDVATVRFESVVDIKAHVGGLIGTFLHFGTIEIQTAGAVKEFTMRSVYYPEKAKDVIYKVVHKSLEDKNI